LNLNILLLKYKVFTEKSISLVLFYGDYHSLKTFFSFN